MPRALTTLGRSAPSSAWSSRGESPMAGTWRCRKRERRSRARATAFATRALAPVPVRAQEPELELELELEPAPVQAQAREHLPPPRDWKTRVRTRPGGEVHD